MSRSSHRPVVRSFAICRSAAPFVAIPTNCPQSKHCSSISAASENGCIEAIYWCKNPSKSCSAAVSDNFGSHKYSRTRAARCPEWVTSPRSKAKNHCCSKASHCAGSGEIPSSRLQAMTPARAASLWLTRVPSRSKSTARYEFNMGHSVVCVTPVTGMGVGLTNCNNSATAGMGYQTGSTQTIKNQIFYRRKSLSGIIIRPRNTVMSFMRSVA